MRIAILLFGFAVVGCGNNAPMMTYDQLNQQVFLPTCANFSVCHSTMGASTANHLDMSQNAFASLVNMPSVNTKAAAMGLLRVKPNDSAHSFLVVKLTLAMDDTAAGGYGTVMPQSSPRLTPDLINAIKDWIDRGAPQK